MLIDDDPDELDLFLAAAEQCECAIEVTHCSRSQKIYECLSTAPPPDLILLDHNLADISGLDCLQYIRQRKEFDDVAVVMYSTSRDETLINLSYSNKANRYFVKPNNFESIRIFLNTLCREDWKTQFSRLSSFDGFLINPR